MLGVFLDRESVDPGDLDLSALVSSLPSWNMYDRTTPSQVRERIAGAQVVVTNKVGLEADLLDETQDLQLICVAATGYNNIDLEAAGRRGIAVCNARAYATPSVVQHVFALILSLSTRLYDYRRWVRTGNWPHSAQFCSLDFPIREIAGKTLGVVGYGELGRAVAQAAEAFGMRVLIAQRPGTDTAPAGRLPLTELLPQADILTLHCPLTAETENLIDRRALAQMKPDALLINAARGGIVDEQALADVLRAGQLGGAGIDVLSEEPPRHGNALLATDIPNLIVTPHVAWASLESRQRLMDQVTANIAAFLAGTPRNLVR